MVVKALQEEGFRTEQVAYQVFDANGQTLREQFDRCLSEAGFPVRISNHAGTSLCNMLLYLGLLSANTDRRGLLCGFLHLPPAVEQLSVLDGAEPLELEQMISALRLIIQWLLAD